jgi:hypothetical protein
MGAPKMPVPGVAIAVPTPTPPTVTARATTVSLLCFMSPPLTRALAARLGSNEADRTSAPGRPREDRMRIG